MNFAVSSGLITRDLERSMNARISSAVIVKAFFGNLSSAIWASRLVDEREQLMESSPEFCH